MKQKFIEWFTNNNNGCSPAMEDDRSFVREKTQHMFEAYQAGVAEGEARCAELAAENARLKKIVDFVTDLDNEPQYHDEGMGCGLEDRGITDRYEAMRHGWGEAMERVYGEVIPCAEEIETPATDAFLAEVRAQGVEMFADSLLCPDLDDTIREFADELRKGVQS